MSLRRLAAVALPAALAGGALLADAAFGDGRPDAKALMKAQREAMAPLAFMDGAWRGEASTILPSGEKRTVTQTERVGPFLGDTVKVIEGRGYDAEGNVAFNAFGIVSYDPAGRALSMRSYAEGSVGDFAFKPSPDGFSWEIPAGPMTIRFSGTVKNGEWHEVGDRVVAGQEPVRFFEMNLKRLGDTTWPADGAVPRGEPAPRMR